MGCALIVLFLSLHTDHEGKYYKKRKIPCLCLEDTGRGKNEKKHVVLYDIPIYVYVEKILLFFKKIIHLFFSNLQGIECYG